MKKKILIILSFFILIEFSYASENKVLLIIGDSLTEGYGVAPQDAFPALIQKKIDAKKLTWTVKAAGSSGSTSASGLERIKWLTKPKPDLVLLLLGSNDGLRGVKPEETEKNLTNVVAWAKDNKIQILLGQLYMPPNYGKEYTKKFEKIFSNVAKKQKIPLVDFLLNNVAGKSDLNLPDGIHPNEKGHKIVAENLYKNLLQYLK